MKAKQPKDRRTLAQIWLTDYLRERVSGHGRVVNEFHFHEGRKWRFDIVIPEIKLAFEVCGGSWNGGHRHGGAIERDYEKLNQAQMDGWRCLYFTNEQVLDGTAKAFIEKYL